MVKTLKKVSKQLQKASRLHKRQSEIVKKYVKKTENKRPKSRNSISWFDGILYIILGLGTYAAYRWIKKKW